jgi:hypothetical protein
MSFSNNQNYDPNQAVFTSIQIISRTFPVLYVVHDNDDDWQFLSGFEQGLDEEIRIISFGEAVELDSKILNVLWLPTGMEAFRKDTDSEWDIKVTG